MTAAFPPIRSRPDLATVRALLAVAERTARQRGITALYLLTTTAEAFFPQRGDVRISREAAPPVLYRTAEFAALCPASAVCLTKTPAAPAPIAPVPATPAPAAPTAPVVAPSAGWTCGSKTTCGQMQSCDEAQFYLTTCGVKRLDGDGDGVPCTQLCKP